MSEERAPGGAQNRRPLLSVRGITKRYGSETALSDVSIDFFPGEVHALVGENGAGKTTLERVIAGETTRDAGEVALDGEITNFESPSEAKMAGISVVHQTFPLVPAMTVSENMLLTNPPFAVSIFGWGIISRHGMRQRAAEMLQPFGLEGLVDAPVRELGVAERQLVEIAKATADDVRVVIFDEPTSSLSPAECDVLFSHIDRIREEGAVVIYVSHRIDEVEKLSDRISVLRDGRLVHSSPMDGVDHDRIVSLIAGRELAPSQGRSSSAERELMLSASIVSKSRKPSLDLQLGAGEVLGLAGLLGSGAQEILARVSGEQVEKDDHILYEDRDLSGATIAQRIAAGICLLPGEHDRSLALHMSVLDNVLLPNLNRYRHGPFVDRSAAIQDTHRLIEELGIKPADHSLKALSFSGGNKQKVAIGKWFASDCSLIVMDDPFRGVDVGAKEDMGGVIRDFVDRGGAVIIYSSDIRDLIEFCDRIIVMREGTISDEFPAEEFSEEAIMAAAMSQEPSSD